MEEEICSVDSCTTNTILKEIKYFQILTKSKENFTTIAGRDAVVMGSNRATLILSMGTQLVIEDALMYPGSPHTLMSNEDIHRNGFHIEIYNDNKDEYLFITKNDGYNKQVLEKIPSFSSSLYYITSHQTSTTCCI